MNSVEKRQYEMLVRVRDFGLKHSAQFPESTLGAGAFAAVGAAVADLDRQGAAQYASRREVRGGAILKTPEGEALVAMLETIARTARAMAVDRPGVEKRFRVPSRVGTVVMLNAARAFAVAAAPLATEFVAHGMPEDFVTQLTTKIAAFEQVRQEREAEKEIHASARASLIQAIEAGLEAVQRLDGIIPNILGKDVTGWRMASRLERQRAARGGAVSPVVSESITPAEGSTGKVAATPAALPTSIAS